MLASGFTGTTSVNDGYLSSYGSSIARAGIRLSPFGVDAGSIQFFANPSSTIAAGTPITLNEVMRINSSGKVGIGTTSPTEH